MQTLALGLGFRPTISNVATTGNPDLLYWGGPVQHHPMVYLDFWGTGWTSGITDAGGYSGAAAQTYIQTFLRDIWGSPWFESQTQYCDGIPVRSSCEGGSSALPVGTPTLASIWNDTATTPLPTDNGIAAEADVAAAHFNLRNVVEATVLVLTPTGQSYFSSGGNAFCGYHAFTANVIYAYIPWMPDAGARCGQNAVNGANDAFGHGHFDGFSIVVGHQVAEAATDPLPGVVNSSGQATFGWIDPLGLETADKCQGLSTWPATNVAFQAGTTNVFAVQPLWTNSGFSCVTQDLGGGTNSGAAVASWDVNHEDVFIRGLDGALWYQRWDGGAWSGWASLGGLLASEPAAVSWGVGRTDVFATGMDGALWHVAWTGTGWSPWQSLGGAVYKPTAASWSPSGLDVAAVGLDRAMWHRRWNGSSWSPWQSLGGGFLYAPSAVSWRDGGDRVDIFAIGLDNQLWQDAWTGSSWSGWLARGGGFVSSPALTSTAPGRLQVYGVGLDFGLWHEAWNGTAWSGFSSLGHWVAGNPAGVSRPSSNVVDLTMVGVNRRTQLLVPGS